MNSSNSYRSPRRLVQTLTHQIMLLVELQGGLCCLWGVILISFWLKDVWEMCNYPVVGACDYFVVIWTPGSVNL